MDSCVEWGLKLASRQRIVVTVANENLKASIGGARTKGLALYFQNMLVLTRWFDGSYKSIVMAALKDGCLRRTYLVQIRQ